MMTGRYPPRTGLGHVVFPEEHPITYQQKLTNSNTGIPIEEVMLSEVLQAAGYNTGTAASSATAGRINVYVFFIKAPCLVLAPERQKTAAL
jgi:hypothetical protein